MDFYMLESKEKVAGKKKMPSKWSKLLMIEPYNFAIYGFGLPSSKHGANLNSRRPLTPFCCGKEPLGQCTILSILNRGIVRLKSFTLNLSHEVCPRIYFVPDHVYEVVKN